MTKTLAEEIITIIKAHSNDNPAPTTGTITRTYTDTNYADVETEDGTHKYIPVIGDNTLNTDGVVVYLDGDLNTPLMITAGSGGGTVDIVTEWETTLSDEKVPSEKLVKTDLDKKIAKSDTNGLVKNDGTIDTTQYSTFTGSYADLTNKPIIPKVYYGTCSTSASTNPKEVTTSTDFVLSAGTILSVKFEYTQTYNATAEAPLQLVVNNQNPVDVVLYGSTYSLRYHWVNGEVVHFIYDGNDFRILNRSVASTTYYGLTKLVDSVSSSSTTMSATPNSVKQAYDLADGKADAIHTHTISDVTNLQTNLDAKADSTHTHSTWTSTILNEYATLYVNEAIHICELKYTRSFSRATEYTEYNWGTGLIPSDYRPAEDAYGTGNNGGVIFITPAGDIKGYLTQTLEARFTLNASVMWHY